MSVVLSPEEQEIRRKKFVEDRQRLINLRDLAAKGQIDPTEGHLEAKGLYTQLKDMGNPGLMETIKTLGDTFRQQGSTLDPKNTMAYEQAKAIYDKSVTDARTLGVGLDITSPGGMGAQTVSGLYGLYSQGKTDPKVQAYLDAQKSRGGQTSDQPGTPGQGATQTASTSGGTTTAGPGDLSAQLRSMEPQELTQVASLFQETIVALEAKQKDLISRAATQKTEIDPDTQASIDRLRESMNEGIMAAKEEANRRGILDSGIALALTQKPRTEFQRGQTYIEGSRLKAIKDRLDQQLAALDSRIYQTQMAKTQGLMSTRQNLLNLYANTALTEQGRAQQQGQFNEQMTYQMGRDQVTDAKGLVDVLTEMGRTASAKEQQAFENALKEAGVTGTYQGQPTFEKQTTEAGFTGTYQGKPTLQAKLPKVKAGGGDILQQYLNTVARLGDVQAMINDPLNRGDKTGLLAQLDTLSNIANSLGAKLGGQYGFGQGAGGGAGTGTGAGTGADTGTGAGTGAAAAKPSGAVDPAVQAWVKEQQRAGVDAAAIAAELRANGMAPARYGIKER